MDQLLYFARCVIADRQPERVRPEDGAESVRLALAVAEAAETGQRIMITSTVS
jgi:predicted dehydrogenase